MAEIVLVRAYHGEPVKMVAQKAVPGLVYVALSRSDGFPDTDGIGFPESDVFVYNSEAYEALARLWGRARHVPIGKWRELKLERYIPQRVD